MKKLTAGIFATLLAVVSADSAYAAIASQGYVDDKVEAVETTVATKADSSTVTALGERVTTAEGEIDTLQSTVAGKADKATTLSGYGITDAYTSADGTELEERVSAVEAPKAQVAANVTGPVSGGTVYTAIQGVSGNVGTVTSDVADLKEDMTQAQTDISGLKTASATHATKTELSEGLADKANTADLGDLATLDAVGSGQITDGAVATDDIANKAVTKEKLADAIVTSLGKADTALQKASLDGYLTKTAADAAYADIGTETTASTASTNAETALTRIGTLTNLTTEAKTNTVAAINEVAKEAADAATAASAADTKAGQAQSAATAAQGDVEALEAVVNNETTGLAAAHTAIDALESGKLDKTGTAARATADASGNVITTTYATKEEIANMATDENLALKQDKTDNSLETTNKTVVGAINEVRGTANSANTAAGAAQDAAEAAQATANAAIPKPSGECSNPANKCVLTFNNSAYAWEVIARGDAE